jgi:hypothetical protein
MCINHSYMIYNKPFFAMDSLMQEVITVCEPCRSRFRDMGIIRFNTTVGHFHDCFRQTGTRANDSTVRFLHSPAIAQYCYTHYSFVLQSVTFTVFVLYGMRHSFDHSMHVMLPKKCLNINRNKLQQFLCSCRLFYLSTTEIS